VVALELPVLAQPTAAIAIATDTARTFTIAFIQVTSSDLVRATGVPARVT
jgi:hypothetical protein